MGSHRPYKERKYEVGQLLLLLRTRARLTQTGLADLVGVNRRSIQNWENGETYPKEERLQRLIAAFLAQGAFTPGAERAEAEGLWQQVSQDAPHPVALFDAAWFDSLQRQAPAITSQAAAPAAQSLDPDPQPLVDWGEAIDVPALYGRETELATLEQWVLADRCRVVALLGLGGIGKTSLALTFAQQAAAQFDVVLFRSLRNAPPPGPLLDGLIDATSDRQATPPDRAPDKIALLVQLMRDRRCLLVLDNLETVMQAEVHAGGYRAGHADYGALIQRLSETAHQSCLILTSREKPAELGPLEGRAAPVRTLLLAGLAEQACRTILETKDIVGAAPEVGALARLYGGNPLALKLVAEPIRELFGGDVQAFLASGDAFFNGVGQLLEQQFGRSTPLEQAVMYWLAIERELVTLGGLLADLRETAVQREVLQALESLRRRLVIERGADQPAFTLQPVIMEFMTDRLVEHMRQEIMEGSPALLQSHALVQATARDYVRQSQEQLIARPLLEQVTAICGSSDEAARRLQDLLAGWRGRTAPAQGYGPGNVVNLLRLLRGNLRGLDFSHLAIRQAYLQEVEVQDTSLAHAHLAGSMLAEAFDYSTCIALSADGAYLAASTQAGEVRLWRLADRTPIMSVSAHTGGVYGVALAPDGQLVVSSSIDGTAKVWAAPGGHLLATLQGHGGGVYCVTLTADKQLVISGGADGAVRLWDAQRGTCQAMLQEHTGAVWDVAVGANGRLLASSSADGTVRLWDVPVGQLLATLQGHTGLVWGVAIAARQPLVASGSADGTVRLWDAASGACLAVLPGHTGGVRGVALTADGQLLASSGIDGTIRLWETASGVCRAVLHGHRGGVWDVALTEDGHLLASASFDGTIRLWEASSGTSLAVLQGHSGAVRTVALAADGRLAASGCFDGTLRLWDTGSGACLTAVQAHTGIVFGVALTDDGQLLASSGHDGAIQLWDARSGRRAVNLQGHTDAVCGVAMRADGQFLASGGRDGTVRLWDTSTGACLTILEADRAGIRDVALARDGRLLASGSFDGIIRLWETDGGRSLMALQAHTGLIWRVALTADGRRLASAGEDGIIRLWDTDHGNCLAALAGHTGAVYGLALTADGRRAVSGGHDGTIRLWDAQSGACLTMLKRRGVVWNVALSADGQLIISGEHDGTVGVWDTRNGALLHTMRPDRPYERMDITGLTGVTDAQRAALRALGALEWSGSTPTPEKERAQAAES